MAGEIHSFGFLDDYVETNIEQTQKHGNTKRL